MPRIEDWQQPPTQHSYFPLHRLPPPLLRQPRVWRRFGAAPLTPINPKEAYILRVHCEDGVEDVGASPPPEMPANKKKPDAVSTHHVHLHSICL